MAPSPRHRVVIVGGGFGGLFAARALRGPADVTLVDRTQHHLFQPLLYQVATGMLSEGQIAVPLRDVLKRHRERRVPAGRGVDVDVAGRTVHRRPARRRADRAALRRPRGRRRGAAVLLRARRVRAVGAGDEDDLRRADDPPAGVRGLRAGRDRDRPGGAAPPAHLRRGGRRPHRGGTRRAAPRAGHPHAARGVPAHPAREHARVLLFDGGDAPLASFGPALSAKAAATLGDLGVELHLGTASSPGSTARA